MATTALCIYCGTRPQYRDSTKVHPYCGRTCASQAKVAGASTGAPTTSNPFNISHFAAAAAAPNLFAPPGVTSGAGICQIPQCSKPVWVNPQTGIPSQYCGNTCRRNAPNIQASLGVNACLHCRMKPRNPQFPESLFCSKGCMALSENSPPGIVEIPVGHPKFISVANQFHAQWKHAGQTKRTARHVYLVLVSPTQMQRYNAHRQAVEAMRNFSVKPGRTAGNENRRWHGTTRKCLLGDPGHTQLCSDSTCALCSIIRSSFDLAFYKSKTSWGRYGRGLYTSATSSKSDSYSNNTLQSPLKSMLLSKVVVGRGQIVHADSPNRTAPDPGFDSVLGEPGGGGQLNYDECVVYTNDAIRPAYLVMY